MSLIKHSDLRRMVKDCHNDQCSPAPKHLARSPEPMLPCMSAQEPQLFNPVRSSGSMTLGTPSKCKTSIPCFPCVATPDFFQSLRCRIPQNHNILYPLEVQLQLRRCVGLAFSFLQVSKNINIDVVLAWMADEFIHILDVLFRNK